LGIKILLDTHALLWWWGGDYRMTKKAQQVIADETNDIFVSAASIWEIATKHRIGKLPQAERFLPGIIGHVRRSRFSELPILFAHAELAGGLAGDHRDPFDRMLIAQAKLEAMPIVSNDQAFKPYGVTMIWD
jgi:PIN domain nuclease of toxin-antitoxin system